MARRGSIARCVPRARSSCCGHLPRAPLAIGHPPISTGLAPSARPSGLRLFLRTLFWIVSNGLGTKSPSDTDTDGTPLYFGRNSVLSAAPLLNAQGPGSSSPGWRTPPCGTCVPRSSRTGAFGLHHATSSLVEHKTMDLGVVGSNPTSFSMFVCHEHSPVKRAKQTGSRLLPCFSS